MSYSFSVPAGPVEDLRERAEKTVADLKANVQLIPEAERDIAAAIDAAERLAASLRDLAPGVHVAVTISGHANAGRTTPQGWSTDTVYVSVSRVRAPSPAGAGGEGGA